MCCLFILEWEKLIVTLTYAVNSHYNEAFGHWQIQLIESRALIKWLEKKWCVLLIEIRISMVLHILSTWQCGPLKILVLCSLKFHFKFKVVQWLFIFCIDFNQLFAVNTGNGYIPFIANLEKGIVTAASLCF